MADDSLGLLTERERAVLAGEQSSAVGSRADVIEGLCREFAAAVADFELLYLGLTDEELRSVFGERGEGHEASMRAAAQYVLALMYYGLSVTGDDVEYRLASAIRQAEADRGMHATVELDVVTEPFLPPGKRITALQEDGFGRVSFEAFDRLFYDERVSDEEFAAVVSAIEDQEVAPKTIRQERGGVMHFERPPTAVITRVETETNNDEI
jgi:hypothetical protein